MGLDIRVIEKKEVSDFRAGSYSGFNAWRIKLASLVSIDLNKMVGFGGTKEWEGYIPFIELLSHSDCDGKLNYEQCKELKEDFKRLLRATHKSRRNI